MTSNLEITVIFGRESRREANKIYAREEDFQMPIGEESFGVPIRELNKIQRKLVHGTPLLQLFSYDEISLWWFIRSSTYPNFKKIVNFVAKFSEFLDQTKPAKMEVKDFTYLNIIQQICKKRGIPLKISKTSFLLFRAKRNIIEYMQKHRYRKIYSSKTEKRRSFYFRQHSSLPDITNKVIFAVPTLYRRLVVNPETGKSEKGEYIQQKIIDLIDDKTNIVGIDLDYTFKGGTEILSERLKDIIHWFPIEAILTKNHDQYGKHREFIKKYQKITTSKEFQELFGYEGISLWDNLENIFMRMTYAPYLPHYLDLFDSLIFVFGEQKPHSIFLPYETGPYALAFITTAKKFGIKTIGIAHAVVDKNNPDYSHDQLATKTYSLGFPLPETTLLFGDFSRRTLTSQGYPAEKFVVFGNPAFFNLNKIESFLANKSLRKKYGIKENQKVILFGTQMLQEYYNTHGRYNYDSQVWRYLLEKFGNKEEYALILKPHPQENVEIYQKTLGEFKSKNAHIIQGDLYELIYLSSVVISIFSTFMLDSLVLKRPVIRVEFDKIGATIPYDEFGVIISTSLEDLEEKIHHVLYNEEVRNDLSKNRDRFIKDQFNIPEDNPKLVLKKLLS